MVPCRRLFPPTCLAAFLAAGLTLPGHARAQPEQGPDRQDEAPEAKAEATGDSTGAREAGNGEAAGRQGLESLRQALEAQRERLDAQQQQLERQRKRLRRYEQRMAGQGAPSTEGDPGGKEPNEREPGAEAGSESRSATQEQRVDAIVQDARSEQNTQATGAGSPKAFEPSFELYGFADVGLQRFWGSNLLEKSTPTNETTFVLGNVNLYVDSRPAPNWRFLGEIRFSLLPDGTEELGFTDTDAGAFSAVDARVNDVTSPSLGFEQQNLGSIIVERAHIDYSFRDWLNVRAGLFLTPVGIWNVDHGTPTLISTTFPGFQVVDVFPERQLGVDLFGTVYFENWALDYHAYVSNGRGQSQLDLTDNKTIGGRLVLHTNRPFTIRIGASGFAGWVENGVKEPTVTPEGIRVVQRFPVEYAEQGIAADISIDVGDFRLRTEVQARRVLFDEGKRPPRTLGPAADRNEVGAYVLGAYRLPWAGLEPFVFMDFLKWPSVLGEGGLLPSAGLNVHFSPAVVLKTQYTYLKLVDFEQEPRAPFEDSHLHLLLSRLAIAF